MSTEESDVGHPDECPLLTGPELDDGALFGDLGDSIKIGKADAAQVSCNTDEDVPGKERSERTEVCFGFRS